jgi:hypothetical protein
MGKLNDLNEARAEDKEARSWKCESCTTLVEIEGTHCRTCAQYWEDVAAGVFDDEYQDDDIGYCDQCQNTGWVDCYCGGDMCVCENNGEEPCPACGD